MARIAQPRLAYRPRLGYVVVLFRGKVIARCKDWEAAYAFLRGWSGGEIDYDAYSSCMDSY